METTVLRTQVIDNIDLDDMTFLLKLENPGIHYEEGQHFHLGPSEGRHLREYSAASPPGSKTLDFLIREIPSGAVSPVLHRLKPKSDVQLLGPFGFFTPIQKNSEKLICVATGTGIAPFLTFAKEHKPLVIHGTRFEKESFFRNQFEQYIHCVSREKTGEFHGRVTDYLEEVIKNEKLLPEGFQLNKCIFMLCGNSDMIYQVHGILTKNGIPNERVKAEVYF